MRAVISGAMFLDGVRFLVYACLPGGSLNVLSPAEVVGGPEVFDELHTGCEGILEVCGDGLMFRPD